GSAFSSLFASMFAMGTQVLSQVADAKLNAKINEINAKSQIRTQEWFDRQNVSNDKADAKKAAVEETELIFGFLPDTQTNRGLGTLAVALFVILLVLLLVRGFFR
ncbi:hypothetical protein L0244_28135, partial [bacterium]|nr:hypothetical protein [bacterium]